MLLITSPQEVDSLAAPSIFLGGAITGATNWQARAGELLRPHFAVCFNPRRADGFLGPEHPAYLESYRAQMRWEHKYLRQADVILFWLPAEAPALTTRFEIGWAYGRLTENAEKKPGLAIGIAPGVAGETYYRLLLPEIGLPVHTTLEETCQYAINTFSKI